MHKNYTKVIIAVNWLHNIPSFTQYWSPTKTQPNVHIK